MLERHIGADLRCPSSCLDVCDFSELLPSHFVLEVLVLVDDLDVPALFSHAGISHDSDLVLDLDLVLHHDLDADHFHFFPEE